MTSLDEAYQRFISIRDEVSSNLENILTEEDAKIQVITRIITECLGWQFSDIGAERKHDNGFSDYMISSAGKNHLIIEAKRMGRVPVSVTDKAVQKNLKLNGPGLTKCRDGIIQAASYAQPNGVPVAVLTDGDAWIVFKSIIPGEDYVNKQAVVFPSLNAVAAKFPMFYELLGQVPTSKKLYNKLFDELHNARILLSSPLVAPIEKSNIYRQQKSNLAFQLEPVFDSFFSRMTGEEDQDLIVECFVETRESRIADHSLEKMTARVLGNISSEERDLESQLSEYLSKAVELDAGESVFIVGPTGAGKSTFVERFFKKTLEDETRSRCLPVRLNFLEASGSLEAALRWVTETLIGQLEAAIYTDGVASWEALRGLYFSDYQRQSQGVYAKLYERDKGEFHEKFGEFMAKKVEEDREGYLKRLLSDIVRSRTKLPIIIADNTDEFTPEFKEAIFQYVQSLRVHAKHCIIIFPITDKSAWSFTKTDIYSIYQSKSFYLPTPPPREVFRRRISYLEGKLKPEDNSFSNNKYLTDRGITVSISNLESFAKVIEDSFVNDEYSARVLGELSNYNIRRTLHLARRVITSPIYKIEDLVMAYAAGSPTFNRHDKFMNALIKGDNNFFDKNDIDAAEIVPIFQVDRKFRQSPLLPLRILALLNTTDNAASNVEDRHLSYTNISEYFQVLGCSETSVDMATLKLIANNLLEPFDPSIRDLEAEQRLAISFSGKAHLRLGLHNPVYFEQMALTTEISNADVASMISSAHATSIGIDEKKSAIRNMFASHLIEQDQIEISVPTDGSHFECQRELFEQVQGYVTVAGNDTDGSEYTKETPAREVLHVGVLATVDFFDFSKGFGFVEVEEIGERCFVGIGAIEKSGFSTLNDGDDILCDIGSSVKGPQVVLIHDLQNKPEEVVLVECEVVRLRADRHFGFVSVFGRSDDALFHYSLLTEEEISKLQIGIRFEAEVRINSKNGLQQVRRVERLM